MCGVFRIKTLTPVWTGGVDGECTKLRETSIIGSLRWWFEIIVRGFGCYACNSVGEVGKKCELNYKEFKSGVDPKELICPACYVFGTTNWSRRFTLRVIENTYDVQSVQLAINGLKCQKNRSRSGNVKWWLKNTLGRTNPDVIMSKNSGIGIQVLANDLKIYSIIYLTFKTIEKFGALGSHNSYGFGTIKIESSEDVNISQAFDFIKKYPEKWKEKKPRFLPSFKNAFKIDFELKNNMQNKNFGFILKYALRNKFKKEYNEEFAEKLFGSKKDSPNKFAGKIFVSNCWEDESKHIFRVYGFLYSFSDDEIGQIVDKIKEGVQECLDVKLKKNVIIKDTEDFKKEICDGNG